MGLYDREYYREKPKGLGYITGSVVMLLITINVLIWLIQVILVKSVDFPKFLGCQPLALFKNYAFWQILTANFIHAPFPPWHILGNMLFLFFFGRELEAIYGKRDFLIFYLLAGSLAIFAEAAIGYFIMNNPFPYIFGASGAVMGTVVLFALFFPTRKIYLGLLIPIDAWLLCVFYIILDLSGALGGLGTGVAHWAHLTGGAFGLLYRILDLRWESVRSRLGRFFGPGGRGGRPRRRPRLVPSKPPERKTRKSPPPRESPLERDPVSARIDELLEKISKSGKESLTEEELDFLKRNSRRYTSE